MNYHTLLEGKPDGVYIRFGIKQMHDDTAGRPDENCDGYWPTLDPRGDGFIGHDKTAGDLVAATRKAEERMDAFNREEWFYVGIAAHADIMHKQGGIITLYSVQSSGVWGIESDDAAHIKATHAEQCDELRGLFAAMSAVVEV